VRVFLAQVTFGSVVANTKFSVASLAMLYRFFCRLFVLAISESCLSASAVRHFQNMKRLSALIDKSVFR
jgi:hypothetical protein